MVWPVRFVRCFCSGEVADREIRNRGTLCKFSPGRAWPRLFVTSYSVSEQRVKLDKPPLVDHDLLMCMVKATSACSDCRMYEVQATLETCAAPRPFRANLTLKNESSGSGYQSNVVRHRVLAGDDIAEPGSNRERKHAPDLEETENHRNRRGHGDQLLRLRRA